MVSFLNIKAIHERTFIFTTSGVIPASRAGMTKKGGAGMTRKGATYMTPLLLQCLPRPLYVKNKQFSHSNSRGNFIWFFMLII
ncbi:MAG: hypothetical protein ACR5K3_02400 [Wolbachia sp.]